MRACADVVAPSPLFLDPLGPFPSPTLQSTDRRDLHPDSRDSHARSCRREKASRLQTPYCLQYTPGPSGNPAIGRFVRAPFGSSPRLVQDSNYCTVLLLKPQNHSPPPKRVSWACLAVPCRALSSYRALAETKHLLPAIGRPELLGASWSLEQAEMGWDAMDGAL